jgi:hypothetical protein
VAVAVDMHLAAILGVRACVQAWRQDRHEASEVLPGVWCAQAASHMPSAPIHYQVPVQCLHVRLQFTPQLPLQIHCAMARDRSQSRGLARLSAGCDRTQSTGSCSCISNIGVFSCRRRLVCVSICANDQELYMWCPENVSTHTHPPATYGIQIIQIDNWCR